MRELVLAIATALPFLGGTVYVMSILRGKSRPQRTTYGLFLVISATAAVALFGSNSFWLAGASFLQALVIFGLALNYGVRGGLAFDILCACLCGIGIIAWQVSNAAFIAVVGCIVADAAAATPALVKTWRYPGSENWFFYAVDSVASALFVMVGPFNLGSTAYPLYLCFINAIFVLVIVGGCTVRRFRCRRKVGSE